MKTQILAIAIASLISGAAFAAPPTAVTVLNGQVGVGVNIGAGAGQSITQVSNAGLTATNTQIVTTPPVTFWGHQIVPGSTSVSNSISGYANSHAAGTGYVGGNWIAPNNAPLNAFVDATVVTTLTNYPIPVTHITNGGFNW
jgi:hypothetical protein